MPQRLHQINNIFACELRWLDLPSIAIAGREAHEAVGEVVLVDKAAKLAALVGSITHCLVVVANNSLRHQRGEVVIVAPAHALNSNGNVGRRDRVVANANIRTDEIRLLLGQDICTSLGSLGREAGKVLVGQLDELLVRDAAGSNENHPVSRVVVLDVVSELCSGDVPDILAGSEDGPA